MKPAAMAASLVNLRNVSTHKVVALTLHVPAEQAQAIVDLFGWPTMVSPVSVAIARLEEGTGSTAPVAEREEAPAWPVRARHWSDLTLAEQTGVIRNEPAFWRFAGVSDADGARDYIRRFCLVGSCSELRPGTEAAARWAQLQVSYGGFLRQRNHA